MARASVDRTEITSRFVEIGSVARQLGVAPSTLRTWERRYRLIVPHRGEQGQRLYDPDQVALLRRVLRLIRGGARARAAHLAVAARQPMRALQFRFDSSDKAPRQARVAVDELLDPDGDPRFAFYLRLVASELVSNAVRHGTDRDPIALQLRLYENCAELAVQNTGARLKIKNLRHRRPHNGRGLEIIDALAESWSIETGASGTRVWVRLAFALECEI
jgi:DNA-binding transcriptional MerR regulator